MADQLNMNNLSLSDSQHAPKPQGANGNGFVRSAYIPPHARNSNSSRGPAALDGAPPMNGNGFAGPKSVSPIFASYELAQTNNFVGPALAVAVAVVGAVPLRSLPEATVSTVVLEEVDLTETPTETLVKAVVTPVALATASGETASTFLVPQTPVSSVSSSAFPTTPTCNTVASTSRNTTTFPSRPAVRAFLSPSLPSPTLLLTTT